MSRTKERRGRDKDNCRGAKSAALANCGKVAATLTKEMRFKPTVGVKIFGFLSFLVFVSAMHSW